MSWLTRPANFIPLRPWCDISSDRSSEGEQVPVLAGGAHLAHGVKAEAGPGWEIGIEPLAVHRAEPFGIGGHLGLEHAAFGVEFFALAEDSGVFLGVGDVLGDLGDRVERVAGMKRRAEARGLDRHLNVVHGPEVGAGHDDAEIGLVTGDGEALELFGTDLGRGASRRA